MPNVNEATATILGIVAVLGVLLSWLRWARPRYRRTKRDGAAIRDAILGRDPIYDSITGKELAPALPGIGHRMAVQEGQMSEMTRAVSQLAETHVQLIAVNATLEDHNDRIQKLEEAAVERVVAKAESAAAWRAMEAATLATPDAEGEAE